LRVLPSDRASRSSIRYAYGKGGSEENDIKGYLISLQEELNWQCFALDSSFGYCNIFQKRREFGSISFYTGNRPRSTRCCLQGNDAGTGKKIQKRKACEIAQRRKSDSLILSMAGRMGSLPSGISTVLPQ